MRLNGTGAPTDPSAGTVEQTYARAKQAFAAGALADAESLCRTVVGELFGRAGRVVAATGPQDAGLNVASELSLRMRTMGRNG